MASLTKRNNTWFANFALADGSRTRRSTKQRDLGTPGERADARRRAMQIAQSYEDCARGSSTEAQIRRTMADLFQRVNGRRIEFAQTDRYLNAWLDRVKLHKAGTTWTRYEIIVRGFLASLGAKAKLPLGDIAPADIQAFLDARTAAGRRPTTVRLCAKTLSCPFGRARREGLILTNPCATVEIPQGVSTGRLPFTWPQVRQIFDAAPQDWQTATLLGAFTGARLSDCANMPWSAVDLDTGVMRFIPRKTAASGKEVVMPIHPVLAAHLRQLALTIAHDAPRGIMVENPSGQSPLCPALAGRPIGGMNGLSLEFIGIMKTTGIVEPAGAPPANRPLGNGSWRRKVSRLSFHSLRSTMISSLADAGVAPDLRQALAGHSSERMSEKYTRRGLKLLQAAVEKLPMLEAAPPAMVPPAVPSVSVVPPELARGPAGFRGTAVPREAIEPFPVTPAPAEAAQPETKS